MAVGRSAIECYEGEDVIWEFTLTDGTGVITNISNFVIQLVIKANASASGSPLIGPIVCTITSATVPMKFRASFNVDLFAGTYNVSCRRETFGFITQFVDSELTVHASASRSH